LVAVEPMRRRRPRLRARARLELAALYEEEIEVAVAVGVEHRHAGTHDLGHEVAARAAALSPDRPAAPLFYHDPTWEVWEETADWIKVHAGPDAIVATSAPHFFFLRTGLRAVLPPMEANPETERRLLESVPVSYVIIDELIFLDVSRRYALPAIEHDPRQWRVVHVSGGTKTYARVDADQ